MEQFDILGNKLVQFLVSTVNMKLQRAASHLTGRSLLALDRAGQLSPPALTLCRIF